MLVFVQRSVNIIFHGNIDVFLFVIPVQVHSTIRVARPVDSAFVVFLYGGDEVLCVVSIKVFNTEIVDAEGGRCLSLLVFPDSGSVLKWCIPIR